MISLIFFAWLLATNHAPAGLWVLFAIYCICKLVWWFFWIALFTGGVKIKGAGNIRLSDEERKARIARIQAVIDEHKEAGMPISATAITDAITPKNGI